MREYCTKREGKIHQDWDYIDEMTALAKNVGLSRFWENSFENWSQKD